jgi:hypothetical protein
MNPKPRKKQKYYGIYAENDKFLHGVFPFSKEGYNKALEYIKKISTKQNKFYIKKNNKHV